MRILIASPYLPWPLDSGGNAAQFSTLKCLTEDHDFTLVCPIYNEVGITNAKELQAQLPLLKVRAVFCGSSARESLNSNFLIGAAKWIVHCGRRLLNPRAAQTDRADAPYYPFYPLPQKLIAALQDELSKGVDLCQAEFAEMLPLGSWLPKDVPKLFVHHQIHFVYAKRFLDTCSRNSYSNYLLMMMQTQEQAYLQNFQGIIIFSDQDRQALAPYVAAEKLFISPFPIPADVGLAQELPSGFNDRFLFVASEEHRPNLDALEWLLAEVWPAIFRQLPASQLDVIGKWSDSARSKFATPGVSFSGFASDLPAALRGGIMLVPLRIGSGIRVKIMAALAQGVPVVTTSIGGEGLLVKDGQELMVRDEASEFAAAAVQLARNPDLWNRLAAAGKAVASKHYSPEGVRQRRNEIYAELTQSNRISSTPTPEGSSVSGSRRAQFGG